MRYRLLASYQGAPYEAGVGPGESDVVLFAACPPPEELRFEPATGHWRKQLQLADVQTLHESRPIGTFRGERCIVLDDLNDRLHIVYLGHDAYRAEQLGYWEVDRGVFELITPRQEVIDIVEQRLTFPHPTDSSAQPATTRPTSEQPADDVQLPGTDSGPAASFDQAAQNDRPETHHGLPPNLGAGEPVSQARNGWPQEPTAGYSRRQEMPLGGFADAEFSQEPPGADMGGGPPVEATDLVVPPEYLTTAEASGVAVPVVDEPPLPLEAAARRAATTAARRSQTPPAERPQEADNSLQAMRTAARPGDQDTQVSAAEPVRATVAAPAGQLPDAAQPPVRSAQVAPSTSLVPMEKVPSTGAPPQPAATPTADSLTATAPLVAHPDQHQHQHQPEHELSHPEPGRPEHAVPLPRDTAGPEQSHRGIPHTSSPVADAQSAVPPRRRRAARRRLPTQRIFSDLAAQAAIPPTAYAVGEDVDGAMCLMRTDDGFEVFNSAAGSRHEVRIFQDEESAYFYLFGVLVADAVRTGALAPRD